MKILITLAENNLRVQVSDHAIDFQLSRKDLDAFELNKGEGILLFPLYIRNQCHDLLVKATHKLNLFQRIVQRLFANEVIVLLGEDFKDDLIIKSFKDFCGGVLIGRKIQITDYKRPQENLFRNA